MTGFDSIEATEKSALSSAVLNASASAPEPMSSRLIFLPSAPTRRAEKGAFASVLKCATIDQYSRGTNFSISSFAVADDAQSHRLHAPGRARARQLSPQDRGKGEADEIVERAARPVGVDQRLVDLARMAHRFLNRVLGDRVEHHAIDALVLQQLLALEDFVDVPGDRLALAVRVGRQNHSVGLLDRAADVVEPLGGLGIDLPTHGEIVVRVDRAVLGRQIPHMAERGVDAIVLAQIFVDGLGLGGQLDDHDFHSGSFLGRRRGPDLPRPFGRGIWRPGGHVSNRGGGGEEAAAFAESNAPFWSRR